MDIGIWVSWQKVTRCHNAYIIKNFLHQSHFCLIRNSFNQSSFYLNKNSYSPFLVVMHLAIKYFVVKYSCICRWTIYRAPFIVSYFNQSSFSLNKSSIAVALSLPAAICPWTIRGSWNRPSIFKYKYRWNRPAAVSADGIISYHRMITWSDAMAILINPRTSWPLQTNRRNR